MALKQSGEDQGLAWKSGCSGGERNLEQMRSAGEQGLAWVHSGGGGEQDLVRIHGREERYPTEIRGSRLHNVVARVHGDSWVPGLPRMLL